MEKSDSHEKQRDSELDGKVGLDVIENAHSSDDYVPAYDEAEAKKILRKVDWRLIPMLTLLYVLSFLDRSNSMLDILKLALAKRWFTNGRKKKQLEMQRLLDSTRNCT
jgi:hypothetical protein